MVDRVVPRDTGAFTGTINLTISPRWRCVRLFENLIGCGGCHVEDTPYSHDSCSRSRLPCRTVGAFVAPGADRATTALSAERREFLSAAAATAGLALTPLAANAIRDYENVGLLGGGEIVDVNNANVRVYLKMPGLYPTVAGKIASNGPYNSVSDIYNIPGLTGDEKNLIKKYESRFVAKAPQADYVIDRINNGL